MEKNRHRYELHRKYLKKSSSPEEAKVTHTIVSHHEVAENKDTPPSRDQDDDDDAIHAKNKLRSRFQKISPLPDLSVSQLENGENSRPLPISSLHSVQSSTVLSNEYVEDKMLIQPLNLDVYQQPQDEIFHQSSLIIETSIEENNTISTSSEEDDTSTSVQETYTISASNKDDTTSSRLDQHVSNISTPSNKLYEKDSNYLPLSALHRRFHLSTALSPSRISARSHDLSSDKKEAPENINKLNKPKKLDFTSTPPYDRLSLVHINPVKPNAIQHDRDQSIGSLSALDTTTTTSDSANSISLLTPRNESSAMNIPNASGICRPSEAQLRWAHYHRKERARKTQIYVERLMKTPLLPNLLAGMISGDDDSYTSYEDFKADGNWNDIVDGNFYQPHLLRKKKKTLGFAKKAKNKNIPNLSVGRRVLLRVSARLTQERRQRILEYGFEMEPDSDDHDDEIGIHSSTNVNPTSVPGSIIGLTVNAKKTRKSRKKSGTPHLKGRKSIVNSAVEDEDRLRRFQEAYAALVNAVLSMQQAATTNMDDIDRDNIKRWSRGSISPAISIDGREYCDLQRAPSIRYEKTKSQSLYELIDRGASWLMHLPKQDKINFLAKFLSENKPDTISSGSQLDDASNSGQERLLELIKQLQLYSETGGFKILENSEKCLGGINYNTRSYGTLGKGEIVKDNDTNTNNFITTILPAATDDLNNHASIKIPSLKKTVYSETLPNNDNETPFAITSTKSKNLPPIYRGPITRQGSSQNLPPESGVLLKISAWRTENESIDTVDAFQVIENVFSPEEVLIVKSPDFDVARENQSEDAIVGGRLCESRCEADVTTFESSPTPESKSSWTEGCIDETLEHSLSEPTPASRSSPLADLDEGFLTSPTDMFTNHTQRFSNDSNLVFTPLLQQRIESSSDEYDHDVNNMSHPECDSDVGETSSDRDFIVNDTDDDDILSADTETDLGHDKHDDAHSSDHSESLGDIEASLRYSHTFIDTDKASDVSESAAMEDRIMIGNLMLTPEILNKRLHQAISSIQARSWEQVFYLVSANPWLAEMMEMASKQYLLHQLSFHGASVATQLNYAAPEELNEHLIQMFPHAAQKLDCEGNLPIHYAAMSLNEDMVPRLVELFPSGLSVQNFSGYLPLHLSIVAAAESSLTDQAVSSIGYILNIFPDALAVQDHDGNLPLHLAASCITGELAIGIISMMITKIEKEAICMRLPRKRNRKNLEKYLSADSASYELIEFEAEGGGDSMSTLSVKNRQGCTPLMCAVKTNCDWDVINIFLGAKQSDEAVVSVRENGRSILQMAIRSCTDPSIILSIIKIAPQLVRIRDENGILPIEAICSRQDIPPKIIAATVLVDLPTNEMADEDSLVITDSSREFQGASWWWINCACDDLYVNIVREILLMTSSSQKRILCSVCDASGMSIMGCASPKCRKELQKGLRFGGRFELLRELHDDIHPSDGVKFFDAVDFKIDEEMGTRVLLRCYSHQYTYMNDVSCD